MVSPFSTAMFYEARQDVTRRPSHEVRSGRGEEGPRAWWNVLWCTSVSGSWYSRRRASAFRCQAPSSPIARDPFASPCRVS